MNPVPFKVKLYRILPRLIQRIWMERVYKKLGFSHGPLSMLLYTRLREWESSWFKRLVRRFLDKIL